MTPSNLQRLTPQPHDAQWVASFRDELPITETHAYLNHAGVSPVPARVVQAVHDSMSELARLGDPDWDRWEAVLDACRARFARLIGADAEEIAFVRNTSHGLSLVASGIDWRPSDRIAVCTALEYPSNVYPWLDLERRGLVSVDPIEPERGAVTLERVADALRPETRLLAVSSAQFATGTVTDLRALGALSRERDVVFCVDGIQTVGALPVDVKEAGVHALSADSHKWLLGVMGIGVVFVDRDVSPSLHPPLIGWRSTTDAFNFDRVHLELRPTAARFEEGTLPHPLIAGLSAALELLEDAGAEAITCRVEALVDRLVEGLQALGCTVGPSAEYRRHIVFLSHPAADAATILAKLRERRVVASVRRGAVRVSPHFYNSEEEVDLVCEAVRESIP